MTAASFSEEMPEVEQANESHQEREANYRNLFELAHDVILRVDRLGNILDINRRAEQLTAYSQSELQPMNVFDHLIIPEDHPVIRCALQNAFEGKDSEYEVRWRTKGGTIIHFDGAAVPWRCAGEEILSTLCTLRDVTRQRQAEHALRESEEKYRGLFEWNSEAIIVADAVTGRDLDCNQRAQELTGYSRSELLSMDLGQLASPDRRNEIVEGIKQSSTAGAVRGEWEIQTKDKRRVPVEISSKIVPIGNVPHCQVIFRDIAERKQVEEERARLLEADHQAREEIRALATRLAEVQENERKSLARDLHDQIGQKLTGLGINLNIVRMQAGVAMTPPILSRLDESLALVEETAERIRDVILELRPAVLDDYGLAAALRWYGEQYSKRTRISVEVDAQDLTPRLPLEVETALFRIAQEALTNVARHSQARRVIITIKSTPQSVDLIVADDGIGFDLDALHPAERTGWGLINMRERTEAIGGRLRVESQPRQGTQVIVNLAR